LFGQKDSSEIAVTSHGGACASALAGFEAAMSLVDDVHPAFAANDAIVAVPRAEGFQGISNFHNDTG
jgi:hypothetical protein